MNTIAAGVVLYNPDNMVRLNSCLDSIAKQVDHLYLFDNSEVEMKEVANLINILGKSGGVQTTYITEHSNRGMAYALNRIMDHAKADGYSWVLTMDQDSILPVGMVEDFKQHIVRNDIGIVCPQVIDKRRAYMKTEGTEGEKYLDMCITSASCTSINAWEAAGKFDDWLFIDLIDNDFCKRLRLTGYRILQVNKWVLDQEFGKIIPKSEKVQRFWIRISELLRNKNFAKFSYRKSVNPVRVYYTCRNIIYVNRKLRKYGKTGYENYNCRSYPGFVVSFIIPSILRAQNKVKVFEAAVKGTHDGKKIHVTEWTVGSAVLT